MLSWMLKKLAMSLLNHSKWNFPVKQKREWKDIRTTYKCFFSFYSVKFYSTRWTIKVFFEFQTSTNIGVELLNAYFTRIVMSLNPLDI